MSDMTKEPFPQNLKIGEFTYGVKSFQPMEGMKWNMFGYHHGASLEVHYQENLPIQKIAHVLVHEALHGLWYVGDLRENDDRDQEEVYVSKLTHLMIQFILANPSFIAWVSQTFADETTKNVLEVARSS